jgi:hypothetical protein
LNLLQYLDKLGKKDYILPAQSILFAPLYNIEPDADLLGADFNGYQIIRKQDFLARYADNVAVFNANGIKFLEAESNTNPDYFVINTTVDDWIDKPEFNTSSFVLMMELTLLYLRLHKVGEVQLGSIFISVKDGRYFRKQSQANHFCYFAKDDEKYKISKEDAAIICEKSNKFEKKIIDRFPEIIDVAYFFTRANETTDLAYKIINYVTVLEKLIAPDGNKGEIQFKIGVRLTLLMQEDIKSFITKTYSIRSHILHNGDVSSKESANELAERCAELNRICRFVINYYMDKFVKEDKIKTADVFAEIDGAVFDKLLKK